MAHREWRGRIEATPQEHAGAIDQRLSRTLHDNLVRVLNSGHEPARPFIRGDDQSKRLSHGSPLCVCLIGAAPVLQTLNACRKVLAMPAVQAWFPAPGVKAGRLA